MTTIIKTSYQIDSQEPLLFIYSDADKFSIFLCPINVTTHPTSNQCFITKLNSIRQCQC